MQQIKNKKSHEIQHFPTNPQNSAVYSNLRLVSLLSQLSPKIQCIRHLIKQGADINYVLPQGGTDPSGKTVFMHACQKSGHINVRELLKFEHLQVGAVDSNGDSVLVYALMNEAEDQAVQIIGSILKEFPHLLSASKCSILHKVIEHFKIKILTFLLETQISANEQLDPLGVTPLQHSISLTGTLTESQISELVSVLLSYGADPKVKNYFGEDAFDFADRYLLDIESILAEQTIETVKLKSNNKGCYTVTYDCSQSRASKNQDWIVQAQIDEILCNQIIKDNQERQIVYQMDQFQIQDNVTTEKQRVQYFQSTKYKKDQSEGVDQPPLTIQQYNKFHQQFSQQILEQSTIYTKIYSQTYSEIQPLLEFLQKEGGKIKLQLEIIGSFATGLWTQHSDIDLVFINKKQQYVNVSKLLTVIHSQLKIASHDIGIFQLYLNLDSHFPNIKMKLNEKFGSRRIDLGIFQRKCSGRKYVQFIQSYIAICPIITPLFFVLHGLLESFNLHKPIEHGLKTYTIFLMILTSLQAYPDCSTPSQAFIALVYYFMSDVHFIQELTLIPHSYSDKQFNNYMENMENVKNMEIKTTFNMMDPLNPGNNTGGRNTDAFRLRNMFKALAYELRNRVQQANAQNLLQLVFETYAIFQ